MRILPLVLSAALVWLWPAPARSDTITLRFSGSIDLAAFGAARTSTFEGRVSWDTARSPDGGGEDWARYLLDGSLGAVTATLSIDDVDYAGRIESFSRFETTPEDMFLQLWLEPLIDLDGGPAPDLRVISMDLWTTSPPVFTDFSSLPENLAFLSQLEHRRIWFGGDDIGGPPPASTDAFQVPEPSLVMLMGVGVTLLVRRLGRTHRRR